MRRALGGVVVALFVVALASMVPTEWIRKAWAYSGDFALWVQAGGEFPSHNRPGTSAGRDQAYTDVGTNGFITWGPSVNPAISLGTIPYGVTVIRINWLEYGIYGRPVVIGDRTGSQLMRVDSTGVAVTGKGAFTGAITGATLNVGNGSTFTSAKMGTFTVPARTITAGTTADDNITVSGYLLSDGWKVFPNPTQDLADGIVYSTCRVVADNTFRVRRANKCGSDVTDPAQTYSFVAFR